MDKLTQEEKFLHFSLNDEKSYPAICAFAKALSNTDRLRILNLINNKPKTIYEISQELAIPLSSVAKHTNVLAAANLIFVNYMPTKKGRAKMCNNTAVVATVAFKDHKKQKKTQDEVFTIEMPLGHFTECGVNTPCGMLGAEKPIEPIDTPSIFFSPERIEAELLWFETGFISYNFPNHFLLNKIPSEISFSFEVCSEAINYRNDWPSDISVLINDIEIVTFTSPGDFGGKRGKYTPKYWPTHNTQFGLLKVFTVKSDGVFSDHTAVNPKVKIEDLRLDKNPYIKFSVGIKEDAVHRGGINLFGKKFGNYPQSIIMTVTARNPK